MSRQGGRSDLASHGALPPGGEHLGLGVFLFGLATQLWLWARSSYAWDQVELLRLGVRFTLDHTLSGVGKAMSGGGVIPGSLLQLVVGLPLEIWSHFRAPGLVVVLTQALAGLILWRLFQQIFGPRFAALYLAIYWLGPWRLYHSGFVWEPSYLMLPAAAHLSLTWRQRSEASLWASAGLGLTLVLAPQLHISGFVLTLMTVVLLVRRALRLHLGGIAAGLVVGGATLVPMVLGLLRGDLPTLAPAAQPGMGFVKVFPLVKALGYWFRLGSLDIGRRLRQVVYHPDSDPGPPLPAIDMGIEVAASPGRGIELGLLGLELLTLASVLVALVATWRLLVDSRSGRVPAERGFFSHYVLAAIISLTLAAGLTSQTVQGWHTIVVLHAASIPPAFWLWDRLLAGRRVWRWVLALYLLLRIPLIAVLGVGHPMYRPPRVPLPLAPDALFALEDPRIE